MYINKNILYILKLITKFVYKLLIMFELGSFNNSKSKFRFELGSLLNKQI